MSADLAEPEAQAPARSCLTEANYRAWSYRINHDAGDNTAEVRAVEMSAEGRATLYAFRLTVANNRCPKRGYMLAHRVETWIDRVIFNQSGR